MLNYGSVIESFKRVKILFEEDTETIKKTIQPYDCLFGCYQYFFGLGFCFLGVWLLRSSSLSLMSRLTTAPLTGNVVTTGAIITFVGLLGKSLADIHLLGVSLSNRAINNDLINSLIVPLLIASVVLYFIVKKHFFFLL